MLVRRGAWEDFRDDFARTLKRIRRLSATVESEAEFSRMKREREKYDEVLGLMEKFKETKLKEDEPKRHQNIPSTLNPRFWAGKTPWTLSKKRYLRSKNPINLELLHSTGWEALERPRLLYNTPIAIENCMRPFFRSLLTMSSIWDKVFARFRNCLGYPKLSRKCKTRKGVC